MECLHYLALFMMLLVDVEGHGRLTDPPSRSTMWRYGFDTPHNTDDTAANCGGISAQYSSYGGKCGLCGDSYGDPKPRANEFNGKYGKGIIVRTYKEGETIEIKSQLTANHKGRMEYRICPDKILESTLDQACFDEYLLVGEDGSPHLPITSTQYLVDVTHKVKLPLGLACDACVLQWKYRAGNNWGTDPDGTSCTGCGKQETFQACADIAIAGADGNTPGNATPPNVPEVDSTPTSVPEIDDGANGSDSSKNCNCLDAATPAVCHSLPTRHWSNRH